MTKVASLIRHQVARGKKRRRRGYAEGGDVTADDLIQEARLKLASQAQRLPAPKPTSIPADRGAFGTTSPAEDAERPRTSIDNLVSGVIGGAASLPRRAIENSKRSVETGYYDPAPVVEAAMLPMGTGALAGVPVRAGEKVLGSGPIRAYHGSPHDFEKFDIKKIGSGEGAQSYGHGLYFAENPEVARAYRDALELRKTGPGRPAYEQPESLARSVLDTFAGDADKAIAELIRRREDVRKIDPKFRAAGYEERTEKAIEAIRRDKPIGGGRMYTVNIHADPAKMLDWDRPLHRQPEAIQDALFMRLLDKMPRKKAVEEMDVLQNKTGDSLYRGLSLNQREATQSLASEGVSGIKYLDQGSRNIPAMQQRVEALRREISLGEKVEGNPTLAKLNEQARLELAQAEADLANAKPTSNYVMFDDKLIDILKKYGIAGAAAPGLAAEIMKSGEQHLASGGRVGYAEGGAPDLPDAPWAAPAPQADAGMEDAPWASKPAAPAPAAERTWGDTARSALNTVRAVAPYAQGIPGPIGTMAAAVNNIDPAAVKETVSNIPRSAVEFGKNTVQPILHPIDTATSLKDLGLGVMEKTGILSGTEHEKYADAVGQFLVDRYGSIENVKKTMKTDPVGFAGDLSMILTGGGSLAARAPGVIGKVGEVAGVAGRAVDPLRAVAGAGKFAGHVAAEVAGLSSSPQSLRIAQEAGHAGGAEARAFRENITGAAPLESAVDEARGAVSHMYKVKGDEYRQGMGTVKADPTVLDFNKIDLAVSNAQGVKTYAGRSGTGAQQSLSPKTEGIRTEMTNAIDDWKKLDPAEFHSAEGIDALKQQLGDIRDATQPHTPERVVADRIYNAVRQTIVDQVPEYAKVMKGYEKSSKQIKEIETTLSLKPGTNVDTALRKLQSSLRDNVNTSFGRRTELVEMLKDANAPHLMAKLAGQSLKSWTPRGLARFVAAADIPAIGAALMAGAPGAAAGAAAAIPMMMPRLMGEAAYGIGAARRRLKPLASVPRISRQIGQITEAENTPYGKRKRSPYQSP